MPPISRELGDRIAAGDKEAVADLLRTLRPRLAAMAARLLQGRPGGDYAAEDAVQSAVTTFLWSERAKRDANPAYSPDVEGLPGLLMTITCRKALKQIRRRGKVVDQTAIGPASTTDTPRPLEYLATVIPDDEFELFCKELFQMLPDDSLLSVALMRMQGHDQREIAKALGFSERNVRYKLNKIRQIWSDQLEG